MTDNKVWADALAEAESTDTRNPGLWAKCFAESNGDEQKAKAAYVNARVGLTAPNHKKNEPSPSQAIAEKSKKGSIWRWIVGVPVGAFILMMAIGSCHSKDPQYIEQEQARRVIEQCRKDILDPLTTDSVKRATQTICSGLQQDFIMKYKREP